MNVPTAVSPLLRRYNTGLHGLTPNGLINSVGFSEITSEGIIKPVRTASVAHESIITAKLFLSNANDSFFVFSLGPGFLKCVTMFFPSENTLLRVQ